MRYHWTCTAMCVSDLEDQRPAKAFTRMVTARSLDGVVDTAPGTTRQEVYQDVMDAVRSGLGLAVDDDLVILNFDLAPNDIPHPRGWRRVFRRGARPESHGTSE